MYLLYYLRSKQQIHGCVIMTWPNFNRPPTDLRLSWWSLAWLCWTDWKPFSTCAYGAKFKEHNSCHFFIHTQNQMADYFFSMKTNSWFH